MNNDTNKKWIPVFVIAMFTLGLGIAQAAPDPFCIQAKLDFKGRFYIAKEALYDTQIAYDEIIKIERDEDEIRKGSELVVKNVSCKRKKVEMTLKPLGPGDGVEIFFWLSEEDRLKDDAREKLEKMMTYVFKDVEEEESE